MSRSREDAAAMMNYQYQQQHGSFGDPNASLPLGTAYYSRNLLYQGYSSSEFASEWLCDEDVKPNIVWVSL